MAPAPYKRVSSSNGGMGGGGAAAGSITSAKAKQHVFKDESLRCVLSAETGVFTGAQRQSGAGQWGGRWMLRSKAPARFFMRQHVPVMTYSLSACLTASAHRLVNGLWAA